MTAALGSGLDRLAEVKQQWDPENRFRIDRAVAPALGLS
ncbi:MAG: BBE domain-containing protein [Thermoanaerobaculia bacterium]